MNLEKKWITFFLLMLIVSLSGCHNMKTQKEDSDAIALPLEENFTPPNFEINKFKIKTSPLGVEYSIDYTLRSKLHFVLNMHNSEYYFLINIPEKISAIIKEQETDLIPGQRTFSFNQLNYNITFNLQTSRMLSIKEQQEIKTNKEGYSFYILNHEKRPIHFFDDIELLYESSK